MGRRTNDMLGDHPHPGPGKARPRAKRFGNALLVGGSVLAATLTTLPALAGGADLPAVKVPFVAASLLIQYPLMIILPIVAGLWLRKRLQLPLWIWGVGMASFVASQVVHIPMNYVLGIGGGPGPVSRAPFVVQTIAVGLTAGLCEEIARWVAMKLMLRKGRSGWPTALLFGAGHGGVEAILFGLMAAYALASMLVLPLLGEEVAKQPAVQAAAWTYWTTDWYVPIYAGVERVSAMMVHVGLSVLVMRAVVRRNVLYLLAAIGVHTLLNALIMPMQAARVDPLWQESFFLAFGAATLGLAMLLREAAPREAGGPRASAPEG